MKWRTESASKARTHTRTLGEQAARTACAAWMPSHRAPLSAPRGCRVGAWRWAESARDEVVSTRLCHSLVLIFTLPCSLARQSAPPPRTPPLHTHIVRDLATAMASSEEATAAPAAADNALLAALRRAREGRRACPPGGSHQQEPPATHGAGGSGGAGAGLHSPQRYAPGDHGAPLDEAHEAGARAQQPQVRVRLPALRNEGAILAAGVGSSRSTRTHGFCALRRLYRCHRAALRALGETTACSSDGGGGGLTASPYEKRWSSRVVVRAAQKNCPPRARRGGDRRPRRGKRGVREPCGCRRSWHDMD